VKELEEYAEALRFPTPEKQPHTIIPIISINHNLHYLKKKKESVLSADPELFRTVPGHS